MKRLVIEFGKGLGFLATVAGLYLAADAAGEPIWGAVVIGGALVWAGGRTGGPRLVELVTRIRNYPRVLLNLSDTQDLLRTAEKELDQLRIDLSAVKEAAIHEGRMQILGPILSHPVVAIPEMMAVAINSLGEVSLVCRVPIGTSIPLGARFTLEVLGTREKKGVLEVFDFDLEAGYVHLRCVDATSSEFWATLADRCEADPSPPQGVSLVKTPIPDFPYQSNEGNV